MTTGATEVGAAEGELIGEGEELARGVEARGLGESLTAGWAVGKGSLMDSSDVAPQAERQNTSGSR